MVGEFVFLEIGEAYGGEGGEQGGTGVDATVSYSIPNRSPSELDVCEFVYCVKFFEGVEVADRALCAVVVLRSPGLLSVLTLQYHDPRRLTHSSVVKAVPWSCMRMDLSGASRWLIS